MSYRCAKIDTETSGASAAGFPIGERLNNWLATNQFITVVGLTISWKNSQRRGAAPSIHLFFREGGTRQYAADFWGLPGITVQQQVNQFFAANPEMVAHHAVDVHPPNSHGPEHLVIIYYQRRDAIHLAIPGVYPGYAPTDAPVLPGDWGSFANLLDPSAPAIDAVNSGNGIWPEGVMGILVRNVDAVPDATGEARPIGGIGRECDPDVLTAGVPLGFFEDCGCIDPLFPFPGVGAVTPTTPVPTTTAVSVPY